MRRTVWLVVAAGLLAAGAVVWSLSSGGAPEGAGGSDARRGDAVVNWGHEVVVDSGPGRVGPWRMNRSDWRYVDDPTVALDRQGRASVAWVDQARKDVLFRRFGPDGGPVSPEPVNVSRSPGVFSWLPRLALAPDDPDRIYVLWQEIVFSGGTHGGEAFFARSADGGRTFSEPVNLSETPAGAGKGRLTPRLWHNGSLDLAVGPEGTVYAAWTVYEGGLFLARSTDRGRSFSEPLRVTAGGAGEPARGPSLAVAPGGTVHLAWAVGGDPSADLRHAASADRGRSFTAPRVLVPGPGHADAPKLAAGAGGTIHLAWAESEGAGRDDYAVRYARTSPGGATGAAGDGASADTARSSAVLPDFGEPRTVSGAGRSEGAGARFPSLALAPGGGPLLLWERYADGRDRPRGLHLARAPADGGNPFAGPELVPGTADPAFGRNGSLQGRLMRKLAVNGSGRVAVVNSGFEPGEASRVLLVLGRTAEPPGRDMAP